MRDPTGGQTPYHSHAAGSRFPFTGTQPTTMKNKLVASVLAVAVAAVAIACSDTQGTPLGPRELAGPSLGRAPQGVPTHVPTTVPAPATTVVQAVLWKWTLRKSVSASALIGPEGGVLTLAATGLRLVVPAGAVSTPTQFSVTAQPGRIVAYDFQPAGTHFAVPLRFEQDQSLLARPQTAPSQTAVLRLGYYLGASDLDQTNGRASVAEQNDMLPTLSASSYDFPVNHFSGYIVSWGMQ